jgi:hypothetical protein
MILTLKPTVVQISATHNDNSPVWEVEKPANHMPVCSRSVTQACPDKVPNLQPPLKRVRIQSVASRVVRPWLERHQPPFNIGAHQIRPHQGILDACLSTSSTMSLHSACSECKRSSWTFALSTMSTCVLASGYQGMKERSGSWFHSDPVMMHRATADVIVAVGCRIPQAIQSPIISIFVTLKLTAICMTNPIIKLLRMHHNEVLIMGHKGPGLPGLSRINPSCCPWCRTTPILP